MIKCKECAKEFKSRQGMLSHVRAIHEGIKVGGNPVLTLQGFAELWEHIKGCPNCKPEILATLRAEGYTITEPASRVVVRLAKNPEGKTIVRLFARQRQE